jgi:c-di-GMP-binding flagellar brake protein YcgR
VINPTSHTTHDWDFAGPGGLVVRPGPADYSEFRAFRRYEVDLPVVVGSRSKDALKFQGRTYDLGEGGIGATFESRLAAKKSVCVEINLPHLTEPLVLKARVRHIKGLRHGFQFTGMNDISRQVLRQALRQRMTPA